MIILEEDYELTDQQTQTNIKIPFNVSEPFEKLLVHLNYGPEWSSDIAARKQVQNAIDSYLLEGATAEDYIIENYLPIENFITLSISKNKEYLGGHHNKAKHQTVEISAKTASLGFWPTTIEPADWELQLNCHCLASEKVQVKIMIEGMNE